MSTPTWMIEREIEDRLIRQAEREKELEFIKQVSNLLAPLAKKDSLVSFLKSLLRSDNTQVDRRKPIAKALKDILEKNQDSTAETTIGIIQQNVKNISPLYNALNYPQNFLGISFLDQMNPTRISFTHTTPLKKAHFILKHESIKENKPKEVHTRGVKLT